MTVYHFTAAHLAIKIQVEGITKGAIALFDQERNFTGLACGYVWLTQDPSWNQSWCSERVLIQYDRAAVRFTVEIPLSDTRLYRAKPFLRKHCPNSYWITEDVDGLVTGSDAWMIYKGKIPRSWLKKMVDRSEETISISA